MPSPQIFPGRWLTEWAERRCQPFGKSAPPGWPSAEERILSGMASALRYEDLRESGIACVAGWDRRAPCDPDLPALSVLLVLMSLHQPHN